MSTPVSSLPATSKTSTGDDPIATTEEEVFTPEELQKFHDIIRLADLAVGSLKNPNAATAENCQALAIMKEAGVVKPDMTPKEGRRSIGALWKAVDDLLTGNGTTSEGFNLLHRLLVLTAHRTQDPVLT